jgi:hypothetical protein
VSAASDKAEALRHAREMVAALRAKMVDAAGVQTVATDGLTVTYSQGRDGLLGQLKYWERQVQKLEGNGSGSATIDLSGGL